MDPTAKLILQVSVFGLVIALWLAGVMLWYLRRSSQSEQIHQRLGIGTQPAEQGRVLRLWHDGKMVETTVRGEVRRGVLERLEHLRQDAGWSLPMPSLLAMVAIAMLLLAGALFLITASLLLPLVAAVLVPVGFRGYLQYCINKRMALYEKQLVDALDLGARSLRAGHPLSGAFHLVAQEIAAPVGDLFSEICEQESLGISLQDSLARAAERSRSPDMKIFAASVIIQLRSGGNLADMMERVAWVIRERMRLSRRARVLTAEAQLSKWVLLALPLGLFLVLNVMNPQYMQPLYDTMMGHILMAAAVAGMLIGSWVMSRMAVLKY